MKKHEFLIGSKHVLSRLFPEDVWANFDIIEKIGAGGMGIVFKAMHHSPRRMVALKVLSAEKLVVAFPHQSFFKRG